VVCDKPLGFGIRVQCSVPESLVSESEKDEAYNSLKGLSNSNSTVFILCPHKTNQYVLWCPDTDTNKNVFSSLIYGCKPINFLIALIAAINFSSCINRVLTHVVMYRDSLP